MSKKNKKKKNKMARKVQQAERLKCMHVVLNIPHVNVHSLQFTLSSSWMWTSALIHPPHLAAMSSSSPPQPQYWLGKPFIFMYWSGVTADTPPKYCGYGSLEGSHHQCTILKIMSQHNTFI